MAKPKHKFYEWAESLYVTHGLTQVEIADKTGVSKVTINKWCKAENWDGLRQSQLVTRQEQLKRIYMQIQELQNHIFNKPEGERFANSKEADALSKLTVAARTFETDTSIADITDVSINFLEWLRAFDPIKAGEVANLIDDYIKDRLK
uniref:helix-turn-helix domain-containing protein n=1 Tax=uncultured Draconibacterium sp. TaxID=1573823 RepID=UPI00321774BB